uniref:Uncharacterized protein n=1 Tax=Candidatus Kentrum sp. FW TaxID=2126338 RepID=A0A450SY18_9GAMM|nr:MAG: hypothetical protein BECKFW1821B_GA0114236_10453 [Candidatus Kentron sp. FW]
MKTATMAEINREAEIGELLIRKLGVADAARLMSQFTRIGDYTAERHQWLGNLSLDDIRRDIEENEEKFRLSRGKKPDSSVAVASVSAACDEVSRLLEKDQRDRAIRVAEYVLRHEIEGSPEDFKRLGQRLAEARLHRPAAKIVLKGLQRFPQDISLLSSAEEHLESIGDDDTLRKVKERRQMLQLLGTKNRKDGSPELPFVPPRQEKTPDTWQRYPEYLNCPENLH